MPDSDGLEGMGHTVPVASNTEDVVRWWGRNVCKHKQTCPRPNNGVSSFVETLKTLLSALFVRQDAESVSI